MYHIVGFRMYQHQSTSFLSVADILRIHMFWEMTLSLAELLNTFRRNVMSSLLKVKEILRQYAVSKRPELAIEQHTVTSSQRLHSVSTRKTCVY